MSPRPSSGTEAAPVTVARSVSYAAGDFGFNLSFTFCSLFLLYYYTDVLGIGPGTAGLIMMAALIWDGIADPVIGMIANRTTSRWGRYRPYLLFGCVPLAFAFAAMFLPVGLSGAALVVYALGSQIVYRTAFAVVNIPYIALSARMTLDTNVRARLSGLRMIFAIVCGLSLSALTLPLVNAFGGGQAGFLKISILYGVVATGILLLCFGTTKEAVTADAHDHPSFAQLTRALALNKPFLLLIVATILGATGYTMSGKALVYYLKYWAGSETMVTLGLVTTLGTAALAMAPWMMFSRRYGKRATWLASVMINVAAYGALYALAPRDGALLWALLALTGLGNAAFVLTFWSMLPDTVEFGEWKAGVRTEGAIFGVNSFAAKVAFGVGTGLVGVLLDLFGYAANQQQTPETLHGIVAMYALGPLLLFAASGAVIWSYPISAGLHGRLVRAVLWRRRRLSAYEAG